jgi:hypothetical protein
MFTLRCTRKLLDRLATPHDADSDVPPANALGDWYANLIRVGHDQLVVVVNERTTLTLLVPAKGLRHEIAPQIFGALATLLRDIEVPQDVIEREIAAMQPMAFARTASRSTLASMNERAHLVEHYWRDGHAPMDIMVSLARCPMLRGPAKDDFYPRRAARRLLGLDPDPPPPATVVRLHVSLQGLSPAIWRRLVVPETITLPELHRALQLAMGWEDRHLHEFLFGAARFGMPDEDGLNEGLKDEAGVRLGDAIRAAGGDRFTYVYDFGDDWTHDVVVEAVEPNKEGVRGVVCVAGANCCPPEDVGGPPGYFEFLQEVRDAGHERHREVRAWAGGPFDPAAFDMGLVNVRLRMEFR